MRRAGAALAGRAMQTHAATTPPSPLLSRLLGTDSPLDAPAVARLARDGYLILDDALPDPPALATAIRAAGPFLTQNASIFVDAATGTQTRLEKVGVAEAEPGVVGADPALDAACPALAALREESASLAALVAALAPPGDGSSSALSALGGAGAVKAQIARGQRCEKGTLHGGFALHADADEGLDARRLTATLYPSALPPGAGGELLLYPSLNPAAPPITIPPAPGRVVLFSACRMPHAVAPSTVERLCASVWLGVRGRRGLGAPRPPTPVAAVLRSLVGASRAVVRATVLAEPDARRALARLRFGRVWEQSMVRAHGPVPSPALAAAIDRGAAERAALARAFGAVGWGGAAEEEGVGEEEGDPAPTWF